MKFSIIIPTFNEKNNISLLVSKIKSSLKKYKYEIIIVDDSSTDGSKNILLNLNKKNKNVKIIFRKNKIRDLAKSCRDGFEISRFVNLIVMDGDLQHNPKYIPKMIKVYENYNCDFVVGARDLVENRVKSLSIFRQSASFIVIKFFEFFFGKKTIDPMSGFFLFKKKIYKKNKKKLFLKGFKILADLIYSEKNLIIKDVIIKFDYRKKGKSKLNLNILLILLQFILFKFIKKI
jgi:dolichol-phosphate mannosyltransferase